MATATKKLDDLTTAVVRTEKAYKGPYVSVFLPEIEGGGEDGIKVDQYEHVTIANEEKEEVYYVLRGVHTDVPISVFMALKAKYPKI